MKNIKNKQAKLYQSLYDIFSIGGYRSLSLCKGNSPVPFKLQTRAR